MADAKTQSAEDFLAGAPPAASPASAVGQLSAEDFLAQGAPANFNQQQEAGTPAQNQSGWRVPALIGKAIGAGVEGLVTAPGNLARMLLGRDPSAAESSVLGIPPSSADVVPVTNALGITGTPQFTPSSPMERYGTAAVSGATTGLAAAATGGTALLPAMAAGVAGNEAGEATHEVLPGNTWAPVVAGVVSGLGVGGLTESIMRSVGAGRAAKALEQAQEALDAAHKSRFYGGEDARVATVGVKDASKAALDAKQELIDTVVGDASKATKATFDSTAAQLGDSTTLQQAGQSLQAEARSWLSDVLPRKLADVWQPVDAAIPSTMSVPLESFSSALKKINTSAGELEPLATLLKPGLPSRLEKALDPGESLEDLISDSPKGTQAFNWKDVSKLRTTLGDALRNPQVIKDVGAENLDRLYASLTSDMSEGAQRTGAGDLFNAANLESRRLYQIGEGPMARLVAGAKRSAVDPNPESVAASLLSGGKKGASDLEVLRDEIPSGVNELAAAHLRTTGPASWGKLAPETRAALVPAADKSAVLNSSLQAKLQAETNAERELLAAKRDHAETAAAADEGLRTGNFRRSEQVMLAQDAVARAKAGLPPAPNPLINLRHTIENGIGGALGWEFAPTALAHLGIQTNPLALGAVSAAGLALPYLGRSLKNAVKNPGSLAPAVIAGAAGGNPLTLTPRK